MRTIAALALFFAACSSSKQEESERVLDLTPEQRAEFEARAKKGLDEAVQLLKLTPEQEQQFRPVVKADFEQRRRILVGYKDEPRNIFTARRLRADMETVNEATQEKLEQFLTPEQIQTLDEFLDKRREQAIGEFNRRREGGS